MVLRTIFILSSVRWNTKLKVDSKQRTQLPSLTDKIPSQEILVGVNTALPLALPTTNSTKTNELIYVTATIIKILIYF